MDLAKASLVEISQGIKSRKVSAVEVHDHFFSISERQNPKINALITMNFRARAHAEAIDSVIAKGEDPGPLAGVPLAMKDMFCTRGLRTTAGSKALSHYLPPYSATVVQRLQDAGAYVLSKANQDEFAMGSSNENSYFGPCRNPWNLDYVPGGSSGGSAAAVAAGMAPLSFGTDTGGSIRQPASFCGLVGVKPTYGRISRHGIIAFASSLDQAGPISRNVEDAALALEVVSGHCAKDSTSSAKPVPPWSTSLNADVKGLRIGLPKAYFSSGLCDDTQRVMNQTIDSLKALGVTLVEVDLPHVSAGISTYYIVATCEASSNLSRYDGVRFGHREDFAARPVENLEEFYSRNRGQAFGPEVKRRIILGTYALSSGYYEAYYQKACQVRRLVQEDFSKAFEKCDAILGPVTATPAFKIGDKIEDPLQMYLNDIFTISTNLAGLPGMSVPGGFSQLGLPIGVQITSRPFDEQTMLNLGLAIQQAVNIDRRPNVVG